MIRRKGLSPLWRYCNPLSFGYHIIGLLYGILMDRVYKL